MRLCFERLPGWTSLDTKEEFLGYLGEYFGDDSYIFGGYVIQNWGDLWYQASNPMWTILLDNRMDLLARIERNNWIIGGYVVHAYLRERGENEIKVPNRGFRLAITDIPQEG